jgi:hypothetical protein
MQVKTANLIIATMAAATFVDQGAPRADDLVTYSIVLKNHHFSPAEIHVPTGKPFLVNITNSDNAPEEFEMLIPALERVVGPGQQSTVKMRPLAVGRFPFFGENDPDSERGAFVSE